MNPDGLSCIWHVSSWSVEWQGSIGLKEERGSKHGLEMIRCLRQVKLHRRRERDSGWSPGSQPEVVNKSKE